MTIVENVALISGAIDMKKRAHKFSDSPKRNK
jgi:hypothetical protein